MRRAIARAATFALAAFLAGCGGGGGGGAASVPTTPGAGATPAPAGQTAQVTFRISQSTLGPAAASRAPKFVSPATQSVAIALASSPSNFLSVVNFTPSASNCTNGSNGFVCTVTANAPVGTDTLVVSAYSLPSATGSVLSTATVSLTVTANAANTLALTLGGVVASSTVILGTTSITVGTPATVAVTVAALDAAGNIIVGPGNYSSPITLTDSDSSGVTTLSLGTIAAPGGAVTLTYTGGSLSAATITPSVNGVNGTAATFTPVGYAFADYLLGNNTNGFNYLAAIAAGPDGNTWFSGFGFIDSITSTGSVTSFLNNVPDTIITGLTAAGGVMWFGSTHADLGSITSTGAVTYVSTVNTPNGCGTSPPFVNRGGNSVARAPQGTRRTQSAATACSLVNFMTTGPDGYVWFADDNGLIGMIVPSTGVATEWDITQLNGWPGGLAEPIQIAFGSDGAIYAADEQEFVDKITLAGGTPSAVTQLAPPNGGSCPGFQVAVGPDGNVWASDICANLYAIPLTNFSLGALQGWSIYSLTGGNSIYSMTSSPGGVWFTDQNPFQGNPTGSAVYRISNFAGTGPAVPVITTVNPLAAGRIPGIIGLGADGNVWADGECAAPLAIAKIAYGAPATGTQSVTRKLPPAGHTPSSGSRGPRFVSGPSCGNGIP